LLRPKPTRNEECCQPGPSQKRAKQQGGRKKSHARRLGGGGGPLGFTRKNEWPGKWPQHDSAIEKIGPAARKKCEAGIHKRHPILRPRDKVPRRLLWVWRLDRILRFRGGPQVSCIHEAPNQGARQDYANQGRECPPKDTRLGRGRFRRFWRRIRILGIVARLAHGSTFEPFHRTAGRGDLDTDDLLPQRGNRPAKACLSSRLHRAAADVLLDHPSNSQQKSLAPFVRRETHTLFRRPPRSCQTAAETPPAK